jgi:hypothetical protein
MSVGRPPLCSVQVDPALTAFFSQFCTLQINCVTFPHPDTMPEQQLLKPTEWSYCDYFWVGTASGALHCDPNRNMRPEGWQGPFSVKPRGMVLSVASQTGLSFSRSFQQSQGICVVSIHIDVECKENGQSSPSVLGRRQETRIAFSKEV